MTPALETARKSMQANRMAIGLAVVVFLVLAAGLLLQRILAKRAMFPYRRLAFLFTPAERAFLSVLTQAAGDRHQVFGKVRVADVVGVHRVKDRMAYLRAFNRISGKHFDYVVCAKTDMSIVCVVELDDRSHQQRDRMRRDAFLEGVCKAASLPLLRVPVQRNYVLSDIRRSLFDAINSAE
jgi:hypothetical protein